MADERPPFDSLVQRRRTLNGMYAGTFWRHNSSGSIYRVNSVGIRESDYKAILHYSPVECPDMEWDRALDVFMEETETGPRFSRVIATVTYDR